MNPQTTRQKFDMAKVATWIGWRNTQIESAVIARAVSLAIYSSDPAIADRDLDKIAELINHIERNPQMGTRSPRVPSSRYFPIGKPAPGNPETLVYTFDEVEKTILGEGTYP